MRNFRTYDLATQTYHLGKDLSMPRHLREQFLRSLSSIALNLAEGSGKIGRKDQKRFYLIAMGSLRETEAVCGLAQIKHQDFLNSLNQTGACLYRLIQACGP